MRAILLMLSLQTSYSLLTVAVSLLTRTTRLRTASEHRVEASQWRRAAESARDSLHSRSRTRALCGIGRCLCRATSFLAARRRPVDLRVDTVSVFPQKAPSGVGACRLRAVASAPVLSECGARELVAPMESSHRNRERNAPADSRIHYCFLAVCFLLLSHLK